MIDHFSRAVGRWALVFGVGLVARSLVGWAITGKDSPAIWALGMLMASTGAYLTAGMKVPGGDDAP